MWLVISGKIFYGPFETAAQAGQFIEDAGYNLVGPSITRLSDPRRFMAVQMRPDSIGRIASALVGTNG